MSCEPPNHRELCTVAAQWMRRRGIHNAVAEPPIPGLELPDAIGWKNGLSTLVEVKVSLADFRADFQKLVRTQAGKPLALGDYRWYMAPSGILTADIMPPSWGLLEVYGATRKVRVLKNARRIRRAPEGLRNDLTALNYVASRVMRFGDLNEETLRFNPIERPSLLEEEE